MKQPPQPARTWVIEKPASIDHREPLIVAEGPDLDEGERVTVAALSDLAKALEEIEFGTEGFCPWCWVHGHTATERAEHLPECPIGWILGLHG